MRPYFSWQNFSGPIRLRSSLRTRQAVATLTPRAAAASLSDSPDSRSRRSSIASWGSISGLRGISHHQRSNIKAHQKEQWPPQRAEVELEEKPFHGIQSANSSGLFIKCWDLAISSKASGSNRGTILLDAQMAGSLNRRCTFVHISRSVP